MKVSMQIVVAQINLLNLSYSGGIGRSVVTKDALPGTNILGTPKVCVVAPVASTRGLIEIQQNLFGNLWRSVLAGSGGRVDRKAAASICATKVVAPRVDVPTIALCRSIEMVLLVAKEQKAAQEKGRRHRHRSIFNVFGAKYPFLFGTIEFLNSIWKPRRQ